MSPSAQVPPKRQFLRPTFQVTEPSYSIKPAGVPPAKRQFAGVPSSIPLQPLTVTPPALRAVVPPSQVTVQQPTTPGALQHPVAAVPFRSPSSHVAEHEQAVATQQTLPPFALPTNLPALSPPLAPIMPMPVPPAPEARPQKPRLKRQRKQKKPRK